MSTITVSGLYIYPIKSCAGTSLSGVRLDHIGPLFDRRYMIVDQDGEMVTQRKVPQLALITPALQPTSLALRAAGMKELKVPLTSHGPRTRAVVWKHETKAIDQGADPAGWLSEFLGMPVRLVRWADDQVRPVSKRHTERDAQTAFSDGYPLLLISEASLKALNDRLETPLPMTRFRPNIVVKGCQAFEEDSWKELQIGDLGISVVKPCDRCSITTVDPVTAETGPEPLRTLATFRKDGNKVLFGQNCIHHDFGMIRVGDPVRVV